jgi:hypothetical protein
MKIKTLKNNNGNQMKPALISQDQAGHNSQDSSDESPSDSDQEVYFFL